jgi:molybdopterin converting factor small subunit
LDSPSSSTPSSVTLDILPWTSGKLGLGPGKARLTEPLVADDTVQSLLTRLSARVVGFDEWVYDPADQRVHEHCTLLVNGRAFEGLGGLDLKLQPGDELTILPGFSGGSDA